MADLIASLGAIIVFVALGVAILAVTSFVGAIIWIPLGLLFGNMWAGYIVFLAAVAAFFLLQ